MKPTLATRRALLVSAAGVALAGCGQKLYGVDLQTWGDAVEVATGLKDMPGVTLEDAAKVPYSSIGYRIGSEAERMLVLATSTGGEMLWTSSERRSISTRGARIVKSVRLPRNLFDSQLPKNDPAVTGLLADQDPRPVTRLCDFQDIGRYGVPITSQFERKGPETINLLGQDLQTVAFREVCSSDDLGWDFENTFWADVDTGFVWRSIQSIHPKLDPITLEVFRPAKE